MTETNQTSNKILETEKLLDSLSEEMMKLKSVSEVYNRTQEELQRICDSIDTLSKTSSNLANNVKSFLPALEKNLEMSNHNQVLMEKMIADLNLKVDHTLKSYRLLWLQPQKKSNKTMLIMQKWLLRNMNNKLKSTKDCALSSWEVFP